MPDQSISRRFAGTAAALAFAISLSGCVTAPPAAPVEQVDALFVNGHIYTPTGWATTMAVTDSRIAYIGNDAGNRAQGAAQVIDLAGKTVLPGLYDMHVHPILQAKGGEGRCMVPQDAGPARLLELVSACVADADPGDWVTGGQWQASLMTGTPITAATLDAISPDNPLILFDVSGHSVWANSLALNAAGISSDTPNPEGGIIERDADGVPTGILRETAGRMVTALVPPQSQEETFRRMQGNLAMLSGFGIVGYLEAMAFRDDLEVYAALSDAGLLKQHVMACIAASEAGRLNHDLADTLAVRGQLERANFNPNCIKVFADGVPTESHTAAMLEPYAGGQPNAPPTGLLLFDPAEMAGLVADWDKQGISVMFHAAGDRSVREALDAIAAARKANGPDGPIHQVGHSTFIDPADMPRFRALNTAAEFSPYLWDPQPINDDITSAVGSPRIDRVWPIREAFDAGALVIAGSDWAVVPSPNPWIGIETAITRRNPGGGERTFGAIEAITLAEAIRMFTIDAAIRIGRGDVAGSLEAGKSADFIVLDKDPFAIPASEIHTIAPEETWIGGERIFARADMAGD